MGRPSPGIFPSYPTVHVAVSTRLDGNFHIEQAPPELEATRRRFVDLPWSQPDEIHGTAVGVVRRPGEHDRSVFDALVTDREDLVLGIWVGDCAPVAFAAEHRREDGVHFVRVGCAHAGWRGLLDGVLTRTVEAMSDGGAASTLVAPVCALLGPCIHPCCYEFGDDDLRRVVDRYGPTAVGRTRKGRRALDVPAAVRAALDDLGVALDDRSSCTGCGADRWFSHRVRRERERQVMAVWKDADMQFDAGTVA